MAMAREIAAGPSFAHAMTKKMLTTEWAMALDAAIDAEAIAQALCMQTGDFDRAYRAFAAREKPAIPGRLTYAAPQASTCRKAANGRCPDSSPLLPRRCLVHQQRMVRFSDCDPAAFVYTPRFVDLVNGVVEDFFLGAAASSVITI